MLYGIIAVIAASFIFGITPSANKYVILSGMDEQCMVFYQFSTMLICSLIVTKINKESLRIPLKDALQLMVLGIIGMGLTDHLLNLAYLYAPVSIVVLLHFMYPVIVQFIMATAFSQKLTFKRILAIIISLTGLCLISFSNDSIKPLGIIFGLCSALTYAIFSVFNEKGNFNRHLLGIKMFYMSLLASVVYFFSTIIRGKFSTPIDWKAALVLIAIVGVGSFIAFYLITYGIKVIGSGKSAFLNMLEPIFGTIIGAIAYQEPLNTRIVIGCCLVILSVFIFSSVSSEKLL